MALNWNKIQRKNPVTDAKGWYPQISLTSAVSADEVIDGIVEKCTLTRVDVSAVLIALEEVIIEQIKLGNSVRFGSLGSFRPTLKTRFWDPDLKQWTTGGCPVHTTTYQADGVTVKAPGVTADNIAGINVCFTKSSKMKRQLSREMLQFRMVAGVIPYVPKQQG